MLRASLFEEAARLGHEQGHITAAMNVCGFDADSS